MAEMDLSQAEAESLMLMEKHRVDETPWSLPQVGQRLSIPLLSSDKRESFFLDVMRGKIKLRKVTVQNRARQTVVLLRLDIEGASHRNPDGEEISCPHLHIYREGYGDKWAITAPPELIGETDNLDRVLATFMERCNVTLPPIVQGSLL
jgi:hypothetical protein